MSPRLPKTISQIISFFDWQRNSIDEPAKEKELAYHERGQVLVSLLQRSVDGVPRKGAIKEVAVKFRMSRQTIGRVWKRAKAEEAKTGCLRSDLRRHERGRTTLDLSAQLETLRLTPLVPRSTLRSASAACGVTHATLQRRVKGGHLVAHVSNVKPLLTATNKATRMAWYTAHSDPTSLLFHDMFNYIHVDEKLFYLTEVKRRYYLLPGEDVPNRQVRSKRYITKVMMLAAVARPRSDPTTGAEFSGKLGIWPFIIRDPAVRETYRTMLMEKLLPAISTRRPWACASERVLVQQDNAPAHISPEDPQFSASALQQGLDVQLRCQPPNSPDLNCLDLSLFTAIQARQRLRAPRSLDELIRAVTEAYWGLPPATINKAFLSLQGSMDSCIKDLGGNAFKPQHMGKDKLAREGRLPVRLHCSPETAAIVSQQHNNRPAEHSET